MSSFGVRLRKARNLRHRSQEAIAAELGVSKSQVSAWENDKERVPSKHLAQLSRILQVSLDALFFGDTKSGIGDSVPNYLNGSDRISYSELARILDGLQESDRRFVAALLHRLGNGS